MMTNSMADRGIRIRLRWSVTAGAVSLYIALCCAATQQPLLDGEWQSTAKGGRLRQTSAVAGDLSAEEPAEVYEQEPVDTNLKLRTPEIFGLDLTQQTEEQATAKSVGCVACHQTVLDPHMSPTVKLGCVDCHGGDAQATEKQHAHIMPSNPDAWPTSGNPVRSYTLLNHESPEFIRFFNPGDLRVAQISCGECHPQETLHVSKSMMTHGCMLWGAALYNNGSVPFKQPRYGESYSMHGVPQRLQTVPPPTPEEMENSGVLPYLDPLPRFQTTQPGNILRIFERGGRFKLETGIPETKEEPGRPRARISNRGLGTLNRTDPTFLSLEKTRLFDPTLNFLGTNDHSGDYRSSGCTSCHVLYANDRSPVHSGPYSKYGHSGTAAAELDEWVRSVDPMIPKDEPGHPIQHRFTRAVPSSQCIVCHVHPGTNVVNSYLGFMWWDLETDGELMYPKEPKKLTAEEYTQAVMSDPNEASVRGNWSAPEFLSRVAELNPQLKHTQFADFNGHGWVFRAVFKQDRQGNLLDHHGDIVDQPDAEKKQASIMIPELVKQLYKNRDWGEEDALMLARVQEMEQQLQQMRDQVPVHMLDIHLEKGMHCVDCHFVQDVHGNGKLYGEVRAAIEITCTDCHGDVQNRAVQYADRLPSMRTSGPAAKDDPNPERSGANLLDLRTPSGRRRFELRGDRIIQNSMVEKDLSWEVTQVADTVDPNNKEHYNARAELAKTVRFDEQGRFVWGGDQTQLDQCGHSAKTVSCIACHSSWNQSCFGCHLSQKANRKTPSLHFEGDVTRNAISYNFQTLRDDVYMLARDGNVTGNMIGPARSSCAIHVGSYNQNRESIYVQQQTISAEGLSGISFSTNVPHTVRGIGETKNCSDCHVSAKNDNNAILAQLLMQGTNFTNFMGRFCWVAAGEEGLFAVAVTEQQEPQAVIGSTLHEMAFPDEFKKHLTGGRKLEVAHEHPGIDIGDKLRNPLAKHEVLNVQVRGEFMYAACGKDGMRVYDVANIDNKGFSERIVTAPVSPVGQRLFIKTKDAAYVAAPATIAPDPTRQHRPENHEPTIHPIYAYIFIADREEGLILVNVATLLDGDPTNNFVVRELTFNPSGILTGARMVTIVGTYAYVCCDEGLVVVSLDDPKNPQIASVLGQPSLFKPRDVQVQFRYAFVCDDAGVMVLDATQLDSPQPVARIPLSDARRIYVARTYAYVAGGCDGLIILDVINPEQPKIDQIFNAEGEINDLNDVKLGISYVSQFAYLADGKNGMRVVQLTSPETAGNTGFSPRPTPQLTATFPFHKHGKALAISEGVDRDRAVDESGNQIAVFGRIGARPLNLEDQRRMYSRPDGQLYRVIDGQRDYNIQDRYDREWALQQLLRQFYR